MNFDVRDLIENLHDGIYFVDLERKIFRWNKAAETISGYPESRVLGSRCADDLLMHVDSDGNKLCLGMCPLAQTMNDGKTREAEVYLHHRDGHRVPVWIRTTPLRDEQGQIMGAAELFSDLSQKEATTLRLKELEQLTLLDSLTQMANRRYLESEIKSRLSESIRCGLRFGVLFFDIDHFKQFNDSFGHEAGDRALQTIARTLTSTARSYDLFGRWGGEEFVGVIRNVDRKGLLAIGERCRKLIEHTQVDLGSSRQKVTISIGASVAEPGDDIHALIKRADQLMYQSKAGGRNRITLG
ncbi:diguanylate cyclase domain-containing protein [Trichloromonas sp.]|uniref:sensor domain-containing diguanylate cyclase n=1 Tax=Trichloromonas sp. TaxID=3069249 RepID=UPI003D815DC2